MKALIIDDEPLARMIVLEYLQDYPQIQMIQECNDGFEGAKAIHLHQPDLIFLDIQMPKINGFEMLELIENPPPVIFTTAFDEYALKAFETHAVDYLLKPFSKDRFDKAMEKFLNQSTRTIQQQNTQALLQSVVEKNASINRIVVKTAGKIKIIPLPEIFYLEAADDYVKIHTKEGTFLKNKTMGSFEKALDQQLFVRTHRSYIVNIQEITRLDPYEKENYVAILKSGTKIPVSKNGYTKLKSILGI
ncbi:LytTR family transcriptional regulator DNA-binding domain-containing protein [Chitinophagaceae bacterium LB-8]|uniref:LytTR family transcriptional regulator DNA-binding domain-containing protein n=1 Tax=Paraflavisolibacter caeni TaxID=2982496 RepID=A0A9X2XZ34_9BACT|nr:LytTR family transcriptional regulator DNA-binding domain-containing protein [Paraflavisolibacter caeni]MCU7552071.1 LytTR family transcriptional regulator DNA-binding domain-containing protein [Paraflavisolibacter caeni]